MLVTVCNAVSVLFWCFLACKLHSLVWKMPTLQLEAFEKTGLNEIYFYSNEDKILN